jgi:hypothetical protein
MFEILKEKLLGWTPEKTQQFYNNIDRFAYQSNITWEIDSAGYFVISPSRTAYHSYDGKTYALNKIDGEAFSTQLAITNYINELPDSIKIPSTSKVEFVFISRNAYIYTEMVNPVSSQGLNFNSLMLVDKADLEEAGLKIILKYLEGLYEQLNAVDAVYENNTGLYPDISICDLMYDANTDTYFWAPSITYIRSRDAFLNDCNYFIADIAQTFNKFFKTDFNFQTAINNLVSTKCTTFQIPQ